MGGWQLSQGVPFLPTPFGQRAPFAPATSSPAGSYAYYIRERITSFGSWFTEFVIDLWMVDGRYGEPVVMRLTPSYGHVSHVSRLEQDCRRSEVSARRGHVVRALPRCR